MCVRLCVVKVKEEGEGKEKQQNKNIIINKKSKTGSKNQKIIESKITVNPNNKI